MTKNICAIFAFCLVASTSAKAITVLETGWFGFGGGADFASFDASLLDVDTGLGILTGTFRGGGEARFSFYLDIDIDPSIPGNGKANELGFARGEPLGVQSWEIDHPTEGDILVNFFDRNLDKKIGFDDSDGTEFPNNVSMAMGWKIPFPPGEELLITALISTTAPLTGFYLEQFDPESNLSIYMSGSFDMRPAVPLPAAFWLFGSALIGFIALSRRRTRF